MLEKITENKLTTGNRIAIWVCLIGLAVGGLSRGNDIENQQIKKQTHSKDR